jgi:hypothetical protein
MTAATMMGVTNALDTNDMSLASPRLASPRLNEV